MKKREFLALSGAVPLMLTGCGSSSGGSAQIRLVNVSVGYPSLDLQVASTTEAAGVAYGSVSGFSGVPAASETTVLVDSTATPAVTVSTQTRTLVKDNKYTVVAYGYKDSAKSILITENQAAPDAGFAYVSVLHTAVDVGLIDIYLTTGTDISTASPVASRVTAVSASTFSAIAKGTYTLTIVAYGTGVSGNPDIRLQVSGVTLADQQITTIIVAPGDGGVLAHAVLLDQGGSATSYRNTLSRVRVVAATTGGGVVNVAGLVSGYVSPSVMPTYSRIASGSLPAVTVNGADVSYPAGQGVLAAGGDYTILVYGDAAAPLINVITDKNQLPSSTTASKVRLIHADYLDQEDVTLSVNATAAATNVSFGGASLYGEITPKVGVTQLLEVATPSLNTLLSLTANMDAGAVYTLFLLSNDTITKSSFSSSR